MRIDERTSSGDDSENEPSPPAYTSMVAQYCVENSTPASFEYKWTQMDTMRFTCIVTVNSLRAMGPACLTKKAAKHGANRVLWTMIHASPVSERHI